MCVCVYIFILHCLAYSNHSVNISNCYSVCVQTHTHSTFYKLFTCIATENKLHDHRNLSVFCSLPKTVPWDLVGIQQLLNVNTYLSKTMQVPQGLQQLHNRCLLTAGDDGWKVISHYWQYYTMQRRQTGDLGIFQFINFLFKK